MSLNSLQTAGSRRASPAAGGRRGWKGAHPGEGSGDGRPAPGRAQRAAARRPTAGRGARGVPPHVDRFERLAHPAPDLGLRHLPLLQPERHVLRHGEMGPEGVALEHHSRVPLVGRHPGDVLLPEEVSGRSRGKQSPQGTAAGSSSRIRWGRGGKTAPPGKSRDRCRKAPPSRQIAS